MPKRLLHIAIHCWTSPVRVGSHAIARQFAEKGWEVGYIGAPITPLNFLCPTSPVFQQRVKETLSGGGQDLAGRLWHYVPFSLVAPNNRPCMMSPWLFNNWQKFSLPNVLDRVVAQGFGEVDVLLLDSIYQPFWLSSVRYKRCVVRLSDFNAGFRGFGAGARDSELAALAAADLVITASRDLSSWARENGAREAVYIPNGVDLDRFDGDPMLPVEYRSMTGKIAVFVGDMNVWVDLDLITACAHAMPEINFVLIGPGIDRRTADALPNNVHALGVRPYSEVPAYLKHADLGLIPFHQRRCSSLVKHINPLKLYEYFAAGIPVVSTRWSEIECLSSPAKLCGTKEEFVAAARQLLTEPVRKELFYEYARCSAWSRRLDPLFSWLDHDD